MNQAQTAFCEWNAERLNISTEDSVARFQKSGQSVNGFDGPAFRQFCGLSYALYGAWISDKETEVIEAYKFHSVMAMLRMISYPDGVPDKFDIDIETIIDYGCGIAQRSRATAGTNADLVLVDIHTVSMDFLMWWAKRDKKPYVFMEVPVEVLPECDVCYATGVFEHLYRPEEHFNIIDSALRPGGYLIANLQTHGREFMHVSPDLTAVRERMSNYDRKGLDVYKKRR